jgi:hypothetical protein
MDLISIPYQIRDFRLPCLKLSAGLRTSSKKILNVLLRRKLNNFQANDLSAVPISKGMLVAKYQSTQSHGGVAACRRETFDVQACAPRRIFLIP